MPNLATEAASVELLAVPEQDAGTLEVVASVPEVVPDKRAVVFPPVFFRDLVFVVREITGMRKVLSQAQQGDNWLVWFVGFVDFDLAVSCYITSLTRLGQVRIGLAAEQ